MVCSILRNLPVSFRKDPILDEQHGLDVIEIPNNNTYNIHEAGA